LFLPGRWLRGSAASLAALFAMVVASPVAHAQGSTIQALAVGDSITANTSFAPPGYGKFFVKKFEARALGKAGYRAAQGSNPCTWPWADWIRDYPKARLDYVVIEDWYVQSDPSSTCADEDAWRSAMQGVVDAAKAKSAFVIVLAGDHPDISTVNGIDIRDSPVPAPDYPDGIHYTKPGYKLYAKSVVDLLDNVVS
jgi:hypothetical protein